MNSIRPLITISILIAVGVFLYTKINENPAHLVPDANDAAQSASGVPPLTTPMPVANGPASLTPSPAWNGDMASSGTAPQWPSSSADASKTCPVPPPLTGGSTSSSPSSIAGPPASSSTAITPDSLSLPEVPKIPDLPPFPSASEASSAPTAASNPLQAPPTVSPLSLNSASTVTSPTKADAAKTASGAAPPMGGASPASTPPAAAASSNDDDRYGSASAAIGASSPSPASSPASFDAEWPVIQAALAQQELGKAHQMLTHWYGSSSLSPAEAEQVQSLLNQLAGTVVYSNQSCLEPPYVVRAGDTLESIAKQYEVPWQLLAKINGIPAANLVQPGQQLKVIRGPFSATVDLGKSQMTLLVDGRYAGRFPIMAEPSAAACEGQWFVEQKLSAPSTSAAGAASSVYAVASPAPVDHVLVLLKGSSPGGEISITSGPSSPSAPVAAAPPAFHLAPGDADEVADILSVGSQLTIKK
jgi:LysM repeat protein